MATIVFKNGKTQWVEYNVAATVYQVLIGEEKLDPKDKLYQQKKLFVDNVKEVIFDNKKGSDPKDRPWEKKWGKKGQDNG